MDPASALDRVVEVLGRPIPAATLRGFIVIEFRATALSVAESTFNLLIAGPCPLTLDGRWLGPRFPARPMDLLEVKEFLLTAAGDAEQDAAWAELVRRARTRQAAWVIGCVGVALPGLKNIAARVTCAAPPGLAEDIASEVLTEFVAQLGQVDLSRPHIAERMLQWARKAALRAKGRELRHQRLDPAAADCLIHAPDLGAATPEDVLAEAVGRGVISPAEAELITVTRLYGTSLPQFARARGVPVERVTKQRQRAEARLTAAITEGHVSVTHLEVVSGIDQ